jgi:hypothetical protein
MEEVLESTSAKERYEYFECREWWNRQPNRGAMGTPNGGSGGIDTRIEVL